jgi:hypothetical protein
MKADAYKMPKGCELNEGRKGRAMDMNGCLGMYLVA